MVAGRTSSLGQPEALDQPHRLGHAGEHRLGAGVVPVPGQLDPVQLAADPPAGLEDDDLVVRPPPAPLERGRRARRSRRRRRRAGAGAHRALDELVDELHHPGEHVGVGVGQHAVAEVEDVPARGPALLDHPAHLALDGAAVGEQHGRVEVALHRAGRADPADRLVQRAPASRRRRRRRPRRRSAAAARRCPTPKWIRGTSRTPCSRSPRPSNTARECGSTRSA